MADAKSSSVAADVASSVHSARASEKGAPTIGELFGALSTQVTSLVRGEIELTKSKASAYASRMGAGVGLLVGAAVFGLYLLGWVFHTVEVALALVVPAWAASLIVVGILLLIVLVLGLLGKRALDRAKQTVPAPKEGINASVGAFKKGLRHE